MAARRKAPDERRAELVTVTAGAMLERGFSNLTTRDVARRAGVGNGLLSHYFAWDELRRLGFEAIARDGMAATFPERRPENAARTLRRLIREAFSRHADPYWRVWIEAIDAAADDRELAAVVGRHAAAFRSGLETLLVDGHAAGAWSCTDPGGAAWRLLAVHDGLVGFILGGAPPLSRRAATGHFRTAVGHELRGAPTL